MNKSCHEFSQSYSSSKTGGAPEPATSADFFISAARALFLARFRFMSKITTAKSNNTTAKRSKMTTSSSSSKVVSSGSRVGETVGLTVGLNVGNNVGKIEKQ